MPLSDVDRTLLDHCFHQRPFAWESFVDRYLMLIVFVVKHTAQSRRMKLLEHDEFDLVSDVFLTLLRNDFAILRRFRGQSSLATYLTVVARRVVVRKLIRLSRHAPPAGPGSGSPDPVFGDLSISAGSDFETLSSRLEPTEASLVRMFHIERKSVEQIGLATGLDAAAIESMLENAQRKISRRVDFDQGT